MVTVDGGVVAYRAEPTVTPRAALILIHEIWGLVDHIKDVADRYAREGYLVLAPDLLNNVGIEPLVGAAMFERYASPDDHVRSAAQPALREFTAPIRAPRFATETVTKLRLVVDALAAEPGIDGRIAVTGFCFGGTYSFALAQADDRVRAAIPFYGTGPVDVESARRIRCPLLALYGQVDPRIMDALPAVEGAMAEAGVDFTSHVYPDAQHAFFNDTNPTTYDAAAAADAWARTLAFLREHVG